MRTFMHLAAFAAFFLAHRVRPMEVDPEDGAVLIGEDEDVPPVGLPTINEDLRVDPATGARMYDGYSVLRTMPETQEHLDVLRFINDGIEDYWTPIPANVSVQDPSLPRRHVDIMVGPKHYKHVTSYLTCQGVPFEVAISDVQQAIKEENVPDPDDEEGLIGRFDPRSYYLGSYPSRGGNRTFYPVPSHSAHHAIAKRQINFGDFIRTFFGFDSTRPEDLGNHPSKIRQGRNFKPTPAPGLPPHPRPPPPPPSQQQFPHPQVHLLGPGNCAEKSGFNWREYHRMSKIDGLVNCLATEHPDKVTLETIGYSHEGRPLRVLRVGRGADAGRRPGVWIDGGIHAREWISPSSVLFLAQQMVEDYESHKDFLDKMDVYIMPVVNPDGYEYTFTRDRMWRKTRSLNKGSNCVGVDPNRNWGYRWGGEGASPRPCTEIYMGTTPFSESETRAVKDFIMKRMSQRDQNRHIKLFLTFHSYGQYILYPWGYTDAGYPPNRKDLHSLALKMNEAMRADYTIGSAAKVLYPAAGGSDDWAKGEAGIEYSYTVELPDTGRYGFLLPAKRIKRTVKDTHQGVKAMLRELAHNRVKFVNASYGRRR